jgi:2-keto-4-pentenoate hydratase/2-oxohepta-3-ene-1,7-dioic acid hydratase in catechol pathway
MTLWIRFEHEGTAAFGTLENDTITVHRGSMFSSPEPTTQKLPLSSVTLLRPAEPSKMIALWNNFHKLAEKINSPVPAEPLYFIKNPGSFADPDTTICQPAAYAGKVVYEGELGIVIGKACLNASEEEAAAAIFGYTCVNDVTAIDILNRDPTFAQWTRAKGFDGFGPFGPAIATGLDPNTLRVRTILNGDERQYYPISDMVFPAAALVAKISHDMTLLPGDIISCGTSIGVGTMKLAENVIEIEIAGIGTLRNTFTLWHQRSGDG